MSMLRRLWHTEERRSSLNIKILGGIFLGHQGPRRRDIPDKNFMQVAFFCCFGQGVAGMSRDLSRDVPDLEKLYARKLWADFSFRMCHLTAPQDFRVSSAAWAPVLASATTRLRTLQTAEWLLSSPARIGCRELLLPSPNNT